ncbi:MAG: hypothetical protein IPP35_12605 [Elusimicrobia bacterium]|nr:hypothetical protein [Elusimicrobiota bacterium]
MTYTLNYYVGKLDPFGYRVINLLGHVGVGFLLFLLSRRLFFLLFGTEQSVLSFLLVLFFVVHPVNAIVALYTFNRSDILAALASVGAILLFLRPKPLTPSRYVGMVALFVIGLDRTIRRRAPGDLIVGRLCCRAPMRLNSFRAQVRLHLPFWIVLGLYFAARAAYFGSIGDLEAESPWDRWPYVVTQIVSLVRYLQCVFVPAGLSLDHMPKHYDSLAEPAILLSAAGLWFSRAGWMVVRKGTAVSRLVLFSVLWFLIQLAPSSSFTDHDGLCGKSVVSIPIRTSAHSYPRILCRFSG